MPRDKNHAEDYIIDKEIKHVRPPIAKNVSNKVAHLFHHQPARQSHPRLNLAPSLHTFYRDLLDIFAFRYL